MALNCLRTNDLSNWNLLDSKFGGTEEIFLPLEASTLYSEPGKKDKI